MLTFELNRHIDPSPQCSLKAPTPPPHKFMDAYLCTQNIHKDLTVLAGSPGHSFSCRCTRWGHAVLSRQGDCSLSPATRAPLHMTTRPRTHPPPQIDPHRKKNIEYDTSNSLSFVNLKLTSKEVINLRKKFKLISLFPIEVFFKAVSTYFSFFSVIVWRLTYCGGQSC